MKSQRIVIITSMFILIIFIMEDVIVAGMATAEKREIREKVVEMFRHAYDSYMNNAFPADELMPLSCKGRYRGTMPSRGDVDDSLGNFTLTLIDTLDTLVVLGELEEFEKAVKLVIKHTKFDSDINVSVFETNIRVLGGLLGGHVVAAFLKKKKKSMDWYNDELLSMAKEVGYKLLPAFNTTTGIPYPRVNLKHGITSSLSTHHRDTCTACAGTMILEFAALSRLSGEPIFEEKAHKAMDYLWQQRHRASDLVGTVINVHNGDWIRRESGVGAGIDSYYEYVLKAYILLGDEVYLDRFNKHYDAVMKYISQGPMLVDVHMHKPQSTSRHFMDALLAFWPGLQVLKGDIRPAIETHEMLYQIIQRHNFLPEAFTTDFRVHWGQHPLRPEFVESTYFLHKATGDPHYLKVGKQVMENLNMHARVPCGYAAIKDVTTGLHEDQLDSYVLAETFKYLYLLFSEKSDLVLNIDDYIFTTEAHLLPLSLSMFNATARLPKVRREVYDDIEDYDEEFSKMTHPDVSKEYTHDSCPNLQHLYQGTRSYANNLRHDVKDMVDKVTPRTKCDTRPRLRAADFIAGNKGQLELLHRMGIKIATMADGRVQLLHSATDAASPEDAEDGMKFMQEMIQLSRNPPQEPQHEPMVVQLLSEPFYGSLVFKAGPAQFGYSLKNSPPKQGQIVKVEPFNACSDVENPDQIRGNIAVMERGSCMFIDKARNIQKHGAVGGIVIDHVEGSSSETQALFAMSGDGQQDVVIPMVFLFYKEGHQVLDALTEFVTMEVLLGNKQMSQESFQPQFEKKEESLISKTLEAQGPYGAETSNIKLPEAKDFTSESSQTQQHQVMSQETRGGNLYKINAGTGKVQLQVDVSQKKQPSQPSIVNQDVINIVTNPDGSKQLMFRFDQLSSTVPTTKPELNHIYVNLISVLQQRTNFEKLVGQGDYLVAIAKMLETAYFGLQPGNLNQPFSSGFSPQELIDKLTNELEIYPLLKNAEKSDHEKGILPDLHVNPSYDEETDQSEEILQVNLDPQQDKLSDTTGDEKQDKSNIEKNTKEELKHYATEQDLNEVQCESESLNSNQWLKNSKKSSEIEVIVDDNGKRHVVVMEDNPETPGGPDTIKVYEYEADETITAELPPNQPITAFQEMMRGQMTSSTTSNLFSKTENSDDDVQENKPNNYNEELDIIKQTEKLVKDTVLDKHEHSVEGMEDSPSTDNIKQSTETDTEHADRPRQHGDL